MVKVLRPNLGILSARYSGERLMLYCLKVGYGVTGDSGLKREKIGDQRFKSEKLAAQFREFDIGHARAPLR